MSTTSESPVMTSSGDATSPSASVQQENLSHYLETRLPGLIFSGWYSDRVWVEGVAAFRDRIRADQGETETGKVLRGVARKVKKARDASGILSGIDSQCRDFFLMANIIIK